MEEAKDILVLQASYTNPVHAEAICHVLNGYAEDPMGGCLLYTSPSPRDS